MSSWVQAVEALPFALARISIYSLQVMSRPSVLTVGLSVVLGRGAGGGELLPPSGGPTQVGTTPEVRFRAMLSEEYVNLVVAL